MQRAVLFALGAALCAAPLAIPAALHAATTPAADHKTKPYKAPLNAYGQPDLGGFWTNVSMTPESRPAAYGNRAVYTPEEVDKLEAAARPAQKQGEDR